MNEFAGSMQDVESALEQSSNMLGDIESILGSIAGIFSVASMGVGAIVAIITAIVTGLVAIALYIFQSIPVYSLAKKVGLKYAWLSWVPIFHDYFRLFVLCEIAGNKPFVPKLGKFKIENRKLSFLAYVLIKNFANLIVGIITTIANIFIPIVGSISLVLGLIPTAACAWIEYVYLRDLLDIFKEDKKSNNTTSIIITVIDALLPFDLIRTGYLYTLMKKQPLPEKEIVFESTPSSEASTVSVNNSVE
ncbi:MAG: hypothetical protein J6A78_06125 [Clostridia bacterium]|nr:hypothetical protein [Clostridia bacterium]